MDNWANGVQTARILLTTQPSVRTTKNVNPVYEDQQHQQHEKHQEADPKFDNVHLFLRSKK
jgi:hypothetical protein